MICFWWKAIEPKQLEVQLNLVFLVIFYLPEILWYIYGSLFFYTEMMDPCKYSKLVPNRILYLSAHAIIIYSYIYFLLLLSILAFFCIAYKTWTKKIQEDARLLTLAKNHDSLT